MFVVTHTVLKFVNCLTSVGDANGTGAKLAFRDEEDQVSAQYFCRIKSAHCNFSNNPTFQVRLHIIKLSLLSDIAWGIGADIAPG